jgi:uncharacterized protein
LFRQIHLTDVIKVTDLALNCPADVAKSGHVNYLKADFRHRLRQAMPLDDATRTELEAAAFRTLVQHLRERTDVQNIDLMNLAGFCRNCLSNWMKDAADAKGVALSKDESREAVYGMSYEDWKTKHQKEASSDQLAKMTKAHPGH